MSESNKSYRVRTKVDGNEGFLNVSANLVQDYDILEVLSLKIDTTNIYKLHTSDYGCVVGRVVANGGVGVPNAKISIFIAQSPETADDAVLSYLYPYTSTFDKNCDEIRYNLLPEEQLNDCHQNVGTFPSKRMVLDDDNTLEIYENYYKFTTRTNNSGDYMIFGVPVGEQTLHMDIDISDIGILSQKPRDMIYKGYNITQFENSNMFKTDTNLDGLSQIISQNSTVMVYPFWGEDETSDVKITRNDIDVNYKFETTCVFMGSLVSDDKDNGFTQRCHPTKEMGDMKKLITGEGTIEMIRKTPEGDVESISIQGNQLIDGNGVWCYQIPMNLDYVYTDEFGNLTSTDDRTKGIPTRARVRFRVSLNDFESDNATFHLCKVLVPNNPENYNNVDYSFGSATSDDSFRDLLWDNVYTVKSYIPRLQGNIGAAAFNRDKRFSGFKNINSAQGVNYIPYNNMRVNITFKFLMQCFLFHTILWIVGAYNKVVSILYNALISVPVLRRLVKFYRCITVGGGSCEGLENWYFAPNCEKKKNDAAKSIFNATYEDLVAANDTDSFETQKDYKDSDSDDEPTGEERNYKTGEMYDTESIDYDEHEKYSDGICMSSKVDYFVQCTEISMAMEYEVVQFDFYNDWINGMLYFPRWAAIVKPKRTFFWNNSKKKSKTQACLVGQDVGLNKAFCQKCAPSYTIGNGSINGKTDCGNNCDTILGKQSVKIGKDGFVKEYQTTTNLQQNAYYFKPGIQFENSTRCNFFATDLVLLGSLNENNIYGIPQPFKHLTSTSFQMPQSLVATTLYSDTYLYTNGETKCGANGSELHAIEANAENYRTVIDKDMHDVIPDVPVTEYAGIDWGVIGPDQGKNNKDHLYYPGGLFLGLSCVNSQVNLKSCVNLSRACEVGTILSQRQPFHINENKMGHLIPTGFISYDEINDGGFKSEFASLNYNKLQTGDNGRYVFSSLNPINFMGDMNEVKDYDEYNSNELIEEDGEKTAAKRTMEETSVDYALFRLGAQGVDNIAMHFLGRNLRGEYTLPMYENSFYFYFGMKAGATAIEKLYKDYFAECPDMNPYKPAISISVDPIKVCSDDQEGGITLKFMNLEPENQWYILNESGEKITGSTVGTETIRLRLPEGKYTVYAIDSEENEIKEEFTMYKETPNVELSIQFIENTFKKEIYFEDSTDFANHAYLHDSEIGKVQYFNSPMEANAPFGIFRKDSNEYCCFRGEIGGEDGRMLASEMGYDSFNDIKEWKAPVGTEENQFYIWRGDSVYEKFFFVDCGEDGRKIYVETLGKCNMIYAPGLIISSQDGLYSINIKNKLGLDFKSAIKSASWVKNVFTGSTPSESERIAFLSGISKQKSRYSKQTLLDEKGFTALKAIPGGSYTPNTSHVGYSAQRRKPNYYIMNEVESFVAFDEETSPFKKITLPSLGVLEDKESLYNYMYVENAEIEGFRTVLGGHYQINAEYDDSDYNYNAQIPCIYMPFFINAVAVYDVDTNVFNTSCAVVNGIVNDSKQLRVLKAFNENILEEGGYFYLSHEDIEDGDGDILGCHLSQMTEKVNDKLYNCTCFWIKASRDEEAYSLIEAGGYGSTDTIISPNFSEGAKKLIGEVEEISDYNENEINYYYITSGISRDFYQALWGDKYMDAVLNDTDAWGGDFVFDSDGSSTGPYVWKAASFHSGLVNMESEKHLITLKNERLWIEGEYQNSFLGVYESTTPGKKHDNRISILRPYAYEDFIRWLGMTPRKVTLQNGTVRNLVRTLTAVAQAEPYCEMDAGNPNYFNFYVKIYMLIPHMYETSYVASAFLNRQGGAFDSNVIADVNGDGVYISGKEMYVQDSSTRTPNFVIHVAVLEKDRSGHKEYSFIRWTSNTWSTVFQFGPGSFTRMNDGNISYYISADPMHPNDIYILKYEWNNLPVQQWWTGNVYTNGTDRIIAFEDPNQTTEYWR